MNYLGTVGKNAKKAFEDLKDVKHKKIKKVLDNYNQSLLKNSNKIIRENLKDVKNVKRKHLVDRLILNKKRIEGIRHSINEIAKFKDPVGRVLETWRRPNNLTIKRVTTPIGVIGVIYESRPNVTADVAALCLKSGNCSILRGGSEAFNSNRLLANLFRDNLRKNNINQNCVQFIENKNIFAEKTYHDLFDPIRCIRNKNYKLIINFDSDKIIRVPGDAMMGATYISMLDQIINVRERYELYDIKKDKLEKKNLAKNEKYKNIRKELLKKLSNWMKSTKDPLLSNQIKSPFFIDTLKELKYLN